MTFFGLKSCNVTNIICTASSLIKYDIQQVRNKWTQWRTRRDMKRRALARDFAIDRLRLVAIKRNNILPREIKDMASRDFDEIPRASALRQLTNRCVVTSRGRGVVYRWRLSRLVFRNFADLNKLSGIQRALW